MKTITLIRHAKTEKRSPEGTDFDRRLTKRGREEVQLIADFFAKKDIKKALFITSPARRALQTAQLLAEELKYPIEQIQIENDLYHDPSYENFLQLIHYAPTQVDRLFLFGHNPSISGLADYLVVTPYLDLPPAGVATIGAGDNWRSFQAGNGQLLYLDFPMKHKDYSHIEAEIHSEITQDLVQNIRAVLDKHAALSSPKLASVIYDHAHAITQKYLQSVPTYYKLCIRQKELQRKL